jgi:peroxiredoxin
MLTQEKKKKFGLSLVALVSIATVLVIFKSVINLESPNFSMRPPQSRVISTGKKAPNFTLKDIQGNEATLTDFEGKVVLIDFWATWCGPCVKAMPHMQSLYEIYKEKDVIILGINSGERKDKVEPFLKEHKITYRILLDQRSEVIRKYGVRGIPTFFIIDKKGIIRYSYTGMPSNEQIIQQNIEELLAE